MRHKFPRNIDTENIEKPQPLGDTSRVEPWSTTEFNQERVVQSETVGSQSLNDLFRVVAKEPLPADGIEPGNTIEQGLRIRDRRFVKMNTFHKIFPTLLPGDLSYYFRSYALDSRCPLRNRTALLRDLELPIPIRRADCYDIIPRLRRNPA